MHGKRWCSPVSIAGALCLAFACSAQAPAQSSKAETIAAVGFRIAETDAPMILVPAFVDGRGPYMFAVDTGCATTTISADLARRLEVRVNAAGIAITTAGNAHVSMARLASLSVGSAQLQNIDVAIMDFDPLRRASGASLDGILGHNYLKKFKVTIDYQNDVVQLQRQSRP
jgi:predicted aspartyl protease